MALPIIIDPEFQALIPPLRLDEQALLNDSIQYEGVRDPLVVWAEHNILLDGHNRHAIATALGLSFDVRRLSFAGRDEAIEWMYEHQLGRRNLTDDQRATVAYQLQQQRSKIERQRRSEAANERRWAENPASLSDAASDKDQLPSPSPVDTRAAVAKEFKVSERKLKQVRAVATQAPEVLRKIQQGRTTLVEAVREIKRATVVQQLTDVAAVQAKEAQGVYDVLVIDPPWPMEKIERDARPNQTAFDYPTMSEDELVRLGLPASDDCHVWLWTTHKFLPMALRLLEAWGLKYVCTFVWHKPGGFQPIGLPQYNCEFALYARRGSPVFIDTKALPTCFDAPRGAHSEKPEAFYETLRRVTAGRRLDMFNRRQIDGFDGWGKESPS
jgi:N6-adenosine-specific RNA methylase IME4